MKIRSLDPGEARETLAHRLSRRADRIRQISTRFGLRAQRVWMVWGRWSGAIRGEGEERVIQRVELLPTPRVSDLTGIVRTPTYHGTVMNGSVRIDRISAWKFTEDMLRGVVRTASDIGSIDPDLVKPVAGNRLDPRSDPTLDFWWEISEDGRGDVDPIVRRFRIAALPWRSEGALGWSVVLEPQEEATSRLGVSRAQDDDV